MDVHSACEFMKQDLRHNKPLELDNEDASEDEEGKSNS